MKTRNRWPVFCAIVLWTVGGTCSVAAAQHLKDLSPIEIIKLYPPGRNLITERTFERAADMLQWQIKRGETQRALLAAEIEKLRKSIERIDAEADRQERSQPRTFLSAMDSVREQLAGRCLQKMLDARVDIAANEALLAELEKELQKSKEVQAESAESDESDAQSSPTQQELLLKEVKLLESQVERLKELYLNGSVSIGVLDEAELKLFERRARLAELEHADEIRRNAGASQLASRITDLRLETHRLTALEHFAALELEKLANAADLGGQLKRREREKDQLERRLSLRVDRHEQVLAELEEMKLLLKQIQDHKKDDEPEQPDKPQP